MNINAFGTDNYLKYQIRNRLEYIKKDDKVSFDGCLPLISGLILDHHKLIATECVESLSTAELQHACQSRGVRTLGVSPTRLREELNNWIDLHLNHDISGVLLILSRAFDWGENRGSDGVIQSLAGVLSGLPDPLVRRHIASRKLSLMKLLFRQLNETELAVDSEKASYKQKLEVLQEQEELIEDEAEQEKV